jgi:hypothetical protein
MFSTTIYNSRSNDYNLIVYLVAPRILESKAQTLPFIKI